MERDNSHPGLGVRLKTLLLVYGDGANRFRIEGTGVIASHEPKYYIGFKLERQEMGGELKIHLTDSTIWEGLDADQRLSITRKVKHDIRGQIEARVAELLETRLRLDESVKDE